MLSKRAINVMAVMQLWYPDSWSYGRFKYMLKDTLLLDIWLVKDSGHLKGCGEDTIKKIVEFHRTLNNIWE